MYTKKYVIKDLTTLTYWMGLKKDNKNFVIEGDVFTPRVLNAKTFDTIKKAEKEIKIFSVTTGGCKLTHTALEIIQVYFTNKRA